MSTAAETIRNLVGAQRYPKKGWEAFAYYLEDHPGSLSKPFPQLDIMQLWHNIEHDTLDGDWLRSFSQRADVISAADDFALTVRQQDGDRYADA